MSRPAADRLALVLFCLLTIILTWPLSRHPASSVLWAGADTELFMWTLGWDVHALVTAPLSIFNANIFAPEPRTLAYSEHLIGSALLAAPVWWLSGNPVLALNVTSLLTVLLCALGTYVLARRLGIGPAGAFAAGLIFAFAPPRFFRIGQLHLTAVQWIPFSLAFLHGYFEQHRARDLWLASGFFTLQALSSGHGTIFLGVAIVALVAWRQPSRRDLAALGSWRAAGGAALILAPVALVAIPYRLAQTEAGLRRSLVDWAVNAQSFLASPSHAQAWLLSQFGAAARVNETADAYLFMGFLPLVLAIAALWPGFTGSRVHGFTGSGFTGSRVHGFTGSGFTGSGLAAGACTALAMAAAGVAAYVSWVGPIRLRVGGALLFSARDSWRPWTLAAILFAVRLGLARWHPVTIGERLRGLRDRVQHAWAARRDDPRWFYGALTVLSVLLSIGPPLGLWPLVYWLPGLNFIRVPSRFMILALLGVSILAGFGLTRLTRGASARMAALVPGLIVAALTVELAVAPLHTTPYAFAIPAADRWLAGQPGSFTIAEFPAAGTPGALPAARQQTVYMLHSMAHWQKTIQGYSGIEPAAHRELYGRLRSFPSDESLEALAAWNVEYIVVHPGLYPAGEWPGVEARLRDYGDRLLLKHVEAEDRIYEIQ